MASKRPRVSSRPAAPSADLSPIECFLDELNGLEMRGWAMDRSQPAVSPILHVLVDGQEIGAFVCDGARPDVAAAGRGPEMVGYHLMLPAPMADGKTHRLEVRDLRRREVPITLGGSSHAFLEFKIEWVPQVQSHVDGLRHGGFEGWVMRTERHSGDTLHGNCMIRVTCDGVTIGHVRANGHRGDAARVFNGPANCGFRFTPPRQIRSSTPRKFEFFVMPENIPLDGSPCHTSLVIDDAEGRLMALVSAVDTMHRDLTRMRRQLREMVPGPRFSILEYDPWFRLYEAALGRRMQAKRPRDGWASGPLVSVICPIYRPNMLDFKAAIQSVLAQTYANFELVLVDDNSRSKELSAYIAECAAGDPRVTVLVNRKNLGISNATNVGLGAARGEWIAFFDHDDLLVPVALECMVSAAQTTQALVLYSDEDKINEAGNYLSPALKPDWNHRLMLGVNYVCHLLFVQKALLDKAGPLNSTYDGAQDHELILRLSEHVQPSEIHHVPEVLYHWRMTAGSTAETGSNKAYAVEAGQKAVEHHLARLGRAATIESIDNQTFYTAHWTLDREPQVTIVIPYKDQIAITERCVRAILDQTRYKNYDIILVDNWSTSHEAERFRAHFSKLRHVRVIRVEEDFNYSRLNNIAAAQTDAEYLMLMNNDLFVRDPDWLHALVGEAVSDPTVGAVGGKFFYPDGSLQHGGVVLGIGGVAGHVHVGLQATDPGYGARVMFAQEMSAVTAAGVLVRAHAFHQVGGLDEKELPVAFNDIDLCIKLRQAGYKVIYTPEFVADHHESLSRGDDERPMQESRFFHEVEVMKERWAPVLVADPFYHPKFTLDRQPFFDLIDPDQERATPA